MTYHQLVDLMPVIKRAAKSVAFQWPGVIEADDVEQGIHLRLLESPGSVSKIYEMEDRAQYRAIVGIGHQLASQERADYDYYKGSYRYSVVEVRKLLNDGALLEPPEGFNEAMVDLELALAGLRDEKPQYWDALLSRYQDGKSTADDKQYENALRNGLTALVDEMNAINRRRFSERDDGPGSRKVISNSQARHISQMQYSGDSEDGDDYDEVTYYDRYSTGGYR